METVPCHQEHVEFLCNLDGHIMPEGVGYCGIVIVELARRGYLEGRENIYQAGGISMPGFFLRGYPKVTFHVWLMYARCAEQGAVRSSQI
jgi:hypothetical protein